MQSIGAGGSVGKVMRVLLACAVMLALGGVGVAQEPGQSEKAAISEEASDWKVLATSPGVQVVAEVRSDPGKVLTQEENPLEVAQDWVSGRGYEEGRNFKRGKLFYISVGSATINAQPDDKGFIDSRYLAFQRAELDAKAKTAITLGVDLATERGSSEREIDPKERAELEKIVNASPKLQTGLKSMGVADTVHDLFQKVKILANAKLDEAIDNTGSDVAEQRKEAAREKEARKARQKRMENLRNISAASLKSAASAFAEVQGTQIIQTFEGSYKNNYQVAVVTVWSKDLQRIVDSMVSGRAPMGLDKRKAKTEVLSQLPKDPHALACLSGVRSYINQNGENVILAFGQAGVEVIGGREDKAYEIAGKKARLRAMSAMRTFMGEKIAFTANEELKEALALYASEAQEGGDSEYRSISQFQEKIQAVAERQRITGMHGLTTKELVHPFTDKPMVLKVMAWSPSSQAMAQELQESIQQGVKSPAVDKRANRQKQPATARKGIISAGGADEDAW